MKPLDFLSEKSNSVLIISQFSIQVTSFLQPPPQFFIFLGKLLQTIFRIAKFELPLFINLSYFSLPFLGDLSHSVLLILVSSF